MKLYGVRIFVDDFARALDFYGETLGLSTNWSMPEMKAAGFSVGTAELIVEETSGEDSGLAGRFVGVSLQVEDIGATYGTLVAKGVTFDAPPEKQPWGGTLAHFRDPSGNTLTLLG